MFWKRKTKEDRIIEKLEIKQALDIVQQYYSEARFVRVTDEDFIFNLRGQDRHKVLLDRNFFTITYYNFGDIDRIIDLREKNLKIQEEFKDLFEGLKLQEESFIKLKKFMKTSLIEMHDAQKQVTGELNNRQV